MSYTALEYFDQQAQIETGKRINPILGSTTSPYAEEGPYAWLDSSGDVRLVLYPTQQQSLGSHCVLIF